MNQFELFRDLHSNSSPLLIGNCWDITSAKIFEGLGFKAIATSSRALALNLGYEDGQNLPFGLLLDVVRKIRAEIKVPFSVDLERGYAETPTGVADNLERLFEIGISGINIEDSLADKSKGLQSVGEFHKFLSGIREKLIQRKISIFINARTDAFLRKLPNALGQTMERVVAYEAAGADGIFVPLVTDPEDIKQIVSAIRLPLNVIRTPGLPAFRELEELGVKRISMGSSAYEANKRSFTELLQRVLSKGNFDAFG